jgi:hypothetical protein
MTVGAAIAVIVAGLLIAAFLNATIGMIVAIVGVIGLVLSLFSYSRSHRTTL